MWFTEERGWRKHDVTVAPTAHRRSRRRAAPCLKPIVGLLEVRTLLSAPPVVFGPATNYPVESGADFSIAIGDVNRDGHLDLATANYSADTVSVLLGHGD